MRARALVVFALAGFLAAAEQTSAVREAQNDNAGAAHVAVANAEAANEQAVEAANLQRAATLQLLRDADNNRLVLLTTLISTLAGFLSMLAGFCWKAYTDGRDHRWLVDATKAAAVASNHAEEKVPK